MKQVLQAKLILLIWYFVALMLTGAKIHAQTQGLLAPLLPASFSEQPDSAFMRLKEQMLLYRKQQLKTKEAVCLQQMGLELYHLGNYGQALDHLLKADQLFRQQNEELLLGANLNILARVYYYNRQQEKARQQIREALTIYNRLKNKGGLAETNALIGHMHEKESRYDSAFLYQQIALGFAREAQDTARLAKIHENLGSIYEDRSMYDSARYYFLLSLDEYQRTGNLIDQIEVINNLGDTWSKEGDYNKGNQYSRRAMAMALQTGEKYQLQSAYRDISENFASLRQFDSAYKYLDQSRDLVQSIYAMENSYQLGLLQTLYDMERKNIEIAQLNAAQQADTRMNIAILIVLALLAVLAVVVINRQKMKIRAAQTLNESNRKVYERETELMDSELKRKQLEETALKQALEIKSRELSSHILHLIQKNEVMEELRIGLVEIAKDEKRDQKKQVRQLLNKINSSFSQDSYWEEFRMIFDNVHPTFMANVQQLHQGITPGELKLLALVKMNLSSNDTAKLLGITTDSLRVVRYRVKKKLNLSQADSLTAYIHSI